MTVGTGAICEDGKAAVVSADKMVTFGAPMNLQTEPSSLRKIIELTDKVLLVFSGGTADGEQIVSGAKPKIAAAGSNPQVAQIAQAITPVSIGMRSTVIENYRFFDERMKGE